MDFWEKLLRYYAIFGFIAALAVVLPVTTKRLQYMFDEVDIESIELIMKVKAGQLGELEWVRSSKLTSVKVN